MTRPLIAASRGALGIGYGGPSVDKMLRGLPLYPNEWDRPWERPSCDALKSSSCVQMFKGAPCVRCGR